MADQAERDQRTEDATPRRRQEAREKGQVAFSSEAIAALTLVAWLASWLLAGPAFMRALGSVLAGSLDSLGALGTGTLDVKAAAGLLREMGGDALLALFGFCAPAFVLALLLGYGQVGFQIAPKAIGLDPARIDPFKGLGRIFSARSLVRTGLALLKIVFIGGTLAVLAWGQRDRLVAIDLAELGPALEGARIVILRCAIGALVAILVLAALDFAFQRFQHERDLKMSRQEVRDEHKQTDGDPHVKGRIRQIQREMATRRMMQDVPKATVVVTNPTHYAVALRYEREEGVLRRAPHVVAKGVDHVAEKIKEVAREAGVVLYEDVPLARALHAQCEIGDEIPLDLYQAVAGVLAYVYRVQGLAAPAAAREPIGAAR